MELEQLLEIPAVPVILELPVPQATRVTQATRVLEQLLETPETPALLAT